ncbi:MAG: dihydroorotate dehydrogenase [Spirochaetia bacterium]|jgi:dihydroorotate dehydrogenase (NAD+) catalytic subunit|nr:dihydroorotate dehydrogenase [Spirochaetia bacterium]
MATDTSIRIGGLTLKNPVTVASGTAGYGEELSNIIDISNLGAVFTKGLSIEPRHGSRGNRVLETPSGLLNSIGLENVGLREFIDKKLPFLLAKKAVVIPNIAGHSEEENVELCSILSSTEGIAALELNVSCPNVKEGGMAFGTDLNIFTSLLEKTRKAAKTTLIVKLSPNVTDIASFALRAQETGADAVSAVNTFLGMKIDVKTKRPYFQNKVAGLSGPAIRPLAVRAVYQIYEKLLTIPVIGEGGISSLEDMLEFMMAGASAVSVGTMSLVEPSLSRSLIEKLEEYMTQNGISHLKEIIGTAH